MTGVTSDRNDPRLNRPDGRDLRSGPMTLTEKHAGRHPDTMHALRTLEPNPRLPPGAPADLSRACAALADLAVGTLGDGPELTAGLRKLREAKDAFVMQAVLDAEGAAHR